MRRQLNQATFTALYFGNDETVTSELAEPLDLLMSPHLGAEEPPDRTAHQSGNSQPFSSRRHKKEQSGTSGVQELE